MKKLLCIIALLSLLPVCRGAFYQFNRFTTNLDNTLVNGGNLTNLNLQFGGSNFIGGTVVITNLATILRTNFISGKLYTNATGRNQTVYSSCFLVTASVNGSASMVIQEDFTGNTTISTVSSATVGTVIGFLADTYVMQVQADIVPLGVYAFTNISTGAGNSSSLQSGTGFIRTY